MLKRNTEFYNELIFGINLIEDSKYLSGSDLLSKYELKFKHLAGELLKEKTPSIIAPFSMYSFIANESGNKQLKKIMKNLYWALEEKYPGVFDSIKEKIKARNSAASHTPSKFGIEGIAA